MSITKDQLLRSYTQGFAKSMDIQNSENIFNNISPATIRNSWKDVGLELSSSMKNLEKSVKYSGEKLFDVQAIKTTDRRSRMNDSRNRFELNDEISRVSRGKKLIRVIRVARDKKLINELHICREVSVSKALDIKIISNIEKFDKKLYEKNRGELHQKIYGIIREKLA